MHGSAQYVCFIHVYYFFFFVIDNECARFYVTTTHRPPQLCIIEILVSKILPKLAVIHLFTLLILFLRVFRVQQILVQ